MISHHMSSQHHVASKKAILHEAGNADKTNENKEYHEIQKACDTSGFPCNKGELKIHFSKDATIKAIFTSNFRATKTSLFADVLLA